MLTSETLEIIEGRILGRSPSGVVYDGRVSASGRRVAVKILKGLFADDEERRQELWRQLELLRQVDDPRIVRILGYGRWQGEPFYAMEAVDGQTLEAAARRGISFTSDEILHVAEDVARALKSAWRFRLAHGNLKTSNVFVTRDGQVKVADFGLGIPVGSVMTEASLRAWSYVSPEQVSGGEPNPQSDLYSLGVILYELVTGRLPIEGFDSLTSMTYQLHYVQPPSPRELGAVIPRDLDALIMRCLAKEPAARPAGADGLLTALAEVRDTLAASRTVPTFPGDDLGDFEIFEDQIIGEGGMGTLYRGRQKSLNRVVAVKVMRDAYLTDAEFMRRFRREAELLAQVNDPGIIQIFGTGIWRGRFFYAMELVDGEDLATRLEKRGRCAPDEVLRIAEGVARALKAMWKYHIVHRDIKPSNILVTPDGGVKVADLGLAKRVAMLRTDTQVVVGTSEYLSPEQGLGRTVDVRADIYSLGVVLYELLTGRPPFRSEGSFSCVVYQHVHVAPPQVTRLAPDVPPALQSLIERCRAKNPEDRFPSPEALLDEIDRIRQARRGARPSFRLPRLDRRLRIALAAGALVAAAAAAAWTVAAGGGGDVHSTRAYEIAYALGDYAAAMRLAEARGGAGSPEYRRAQERQRQARMEGLRGDLRRRALAGDWPGAQRACREMAEVAAPEELPALRTAARLCADMIRAGELEKAGRTEEALALYRRYDGDAHPLAEEVRAAIRRLGAPPSRP